MNTAQKGVLLSNLMCIQNTGGSSRDIKVSALQAASMTPKQWTQFNQLLESKIKAKATPYEALQNTIDALKLLIPTDHNQIQGENKMVTLHNQTKRLIKLVLANELSKSIEYLDSLPDELFDEMVDKIGLNFTPKSITTVFTLSLIDQNKKMLSAKRHAVSLI